MGLGDIVQGGLGGALGGSTFGPGGTIVGGLLGGLGGFLGGNAQNDQRKRMQGFYDELSRGGPAFTGDYSGFRDNQRNLISQLEAMSQGRGPSLAAEQMKAATDRNIGQQVGMAQSGAGNPAAAAMAAQGNIARLGTRAAQDSMQGRIQEQQNALSLLGLNIHGARDMDEGMNRFNAGQQNQNMWNNQNASMENNRLRGMILGGMDPGQAPSLGERILAGGSSMFGMKAAQNAANKAAQPQGYQTWTNPNAGPRY